MTTSWLQSFFIEPPTYRGSPFSTLLIISKLNHVFLKIRSNKMVYIHNTKRGMVMNTGKSYKSLLILIGWINVSFALIFFQLFCSIMAICMGVVLRSDYHEKKHGLILIIVGIIAGIAGWILNYLYL